ncbi:hypothetical protein GP486_007603 [Trichoglossum hirsutum]|uniref:Oxidoreductase n=1 Tax=Trichoglossum hirsutum TaxID=265104 RepID=A0A9P8IBI9_9PEZI|nr:hypothetical protein GP486_007603 [Trichoglossum hirsutum]
MTSNNEIQKRREDEEDTKRSVEEKVRGVDENVTTGFGVYVTRAEQQPAVLKVAGLELKAIYSRSSTSAKSATGGLEGIDVYSDDLGEARGYHSLLLRDDIQAVIIALPITIQPLFIEKALLAKKHVLSEKPIAMDIQTAAVLMNWYNTEIDPKLVSWSVGENVRSLESFEYARQEVKKLGRVLNFRVKVFMHVRVGTKYFETEWRKNPSYQGGFLLDAGIHYIAGARLLLGPKDPVIRVSAFTSRIRKHLPPIDTVESIWKTKSGATGTFSVSFGTTLTGSSYTVACDRGSVSVQDGAVIVRLEGNGQGEGQEKRVEFEDVFGIEKEVGYWAEAMESGKQDPRMRPEEAYRDLLVLEKILESGERNGVPVDMDHMDL